ncbi:hypothetical protein DU484_18900 (plasmid) [Haloplanus rubicundus]|uniref:Uncharacterized protein n=2 Tax=Haloplanus rubicundus TaxID=1547898 RepID=A0A345EIF5_9EURY|nr:hypothetical protein DU484_18900 [Haloplanus rubicundus]
MRDCVKLLDRNENYTITIPGRIMEASNLIAREVEDATLSETHLVHDDPMVFLEYDPDERIIEIHLPDEPAEIPEPKPSKDELSAGERAVLEEAD